MEGQIATEEWVYADMGASRMDDIGDLSVNNLGERLIEGQSTI